MNPLPSPAPHMHHPTTPTSHPTSTRCSPTPLQLKGPGGVALLNSPPLSFTAMDVGPTITRCPSEDDFKLPCSVIVPGQQFARYESGWLLQSVPFPWKKEEALLFGAEFGVQLGHASKKNGWRAGRHRSSEADCVPSGSCGGGGGRSDGFFEIPDYGSRSSRHHRGTKDSAAYHSLSPEFHARRHNISSWNSASVFGKSSSHGICYSCLSASHKTEPKNKKVLGSTSNDSTSNETELACIPCGVRFGRKYEAQRHQETVHNSRKAITCKLCNKRFGRVDSLKRHQLSFCEKR
ncbi:hypothetical protein BJ741DRAFT_587452 [Chytriomyces cf. hyalinus JEL632]|nr:hypothetical protein BJ741DRAFT_587452 [Chytriomyces cf. hyalinus JEL632]